MKRYSWILALIFLLSSCKVYKNNFDCCVGTGVPCTPITDIERMIIETPEGSPDIFLGYIPQSGQRTSCCNGKSNNRQRVWIREQTLECGTFIEGHYIYINTEVLR